MNDLEHFILTRYNLPSAGAERFVRAREGWLRDRTRLFETYTLPSMRAQSERRFVWLVFFDPQSPTWLRERIDSWSSDGTLFPVFGEEFSREDLVREMRARSRQADARHVLTTNVDNDDAVSTGFVAALHSAALATAPRRAIYLTQGLIKSRAGLHLRTDRHNAFCSVLATWDDPVTCWSDWHNRLHLSMPTMELGGEPGWLQVVHGDNVSNRVRGRLVAPGAYRATFPGVLDDVAPPTRLTALGDRLVFAPLRTARDASRAVLKRAALVVGGKGALDQARGLLARLRTRAL